MRAVHSWSLVFVADSRDEHVHVRTSMHACAPRQFAGTSSVKGLPSSLYKSNASCYSFGPLKSQTNLDRAPGTKSTLRARRPAAGPLGARSSEAAEDDEEEAEEAEELTLEEAEREENDEDGEHEESCPGGSVAERPARCGGARFGTSPSMLASVPLWPAESKNCI